ncbi:uncharacterized protein LOC107043841 [Diachasma alloeum]|uniref:uncharacterized protein LOC107043841 n=1 Tax=Diachasma alloeum TaxID=454923 RepID=UPI0007383EF5|nr:uncharacterized protein LOC107043841 [Diachasma alloeum]
MERILCVRNFLGTIKDLINFVRDSPKRLAVFTKLQSSDTPNLSAFCPTRWCVRVKSLRGVRENYAVIMEFLDGLSTDPTTDKSVSAKVNGFLRLMETFEFFFLLMLLIEIFEPIEILNTELQRSDLCFNESHQKVDTVKEIFDASRESKFSLIWDKSINGINSLDIEGPKIPRLRQIPKRLDSGREGHIFSTPEAYYKKIYYEVFDQVSISLNTRFVSETMHFLDQCEGFILGKINVNVDDIVQVYNAKMPEQEFTPDFDADVLQLHRDSFIDIIRRQ